jgi:NADH dehydrogenase
MTTSFSVVTGAFGYTGKYIAKRLLDQGSRVRTLTRTPVSRSPFGDQVEVRPLNFGDPQGLVASLEGADILYNTYWVRFARGGVTHDTAVENSRALLRAAVEAGVRRVVHVSITNATQDSPLPYFRGKALAEMAVRDSGLSYAIVRPTVLFSPEDILINNIAWFLRRFPVFPIAGDGNYPLQPVFVDDVARLAVDSASEEVNTELDAVGPETFTFEELVRVIRRTTGGRARLLHLPPPLVHASARLMSAVLRDVVLTREEIGGLMSGHLVSSNPPTGATRLTGWLHDHRHTLGQHYASELARHYR